MNVAGCLNRYPPSGRAVVLITSPTMDWGLYLLGEIFKIAGHLILRRKTVGIAIKSEGGKRSCHAGPFITKLSHRALRHLSAMLSLQHHMINAMIAQMGAHRQTRLTGSNNNRVYTPRSICGAQLSVECGYNSIKFFRILI